MKNTLIILATLAAAGSTLAQTTYHDKNSQGKQNGDRQNQTGRDATTKSEKAAAPMFFSCDKVRGMEVVNSAGDAVGTIKDLILDRGSGDVAYVVLKSGTILGLGGKDTVVPFDAFGWNYQNKNVRLDVSPEQVKNWPEFNVERWKKSDRSEESLPRVLATQYYQGTLPVVTVTQGHEPERVHGKITKITRRYGEGTPEEVVVTVSDGGRTKQEVVLGPSWYLSGNNIILYRDADVDIQTVRVTRGGEQYVYASDITMDSRRVPLYGTNGWPHWTARDSSSMPPQGEYIDTPFVLSTEVDGKSVIARGEKTGEVEDLILDASGRRICFLAVDPSTLDARHLVPWSVVSTIGKDLVVLDASKDMIVASAKAPDDLSTLYASDTYKGIYRQYDVPEYGEGRQKR